MSVADKVRSAKGLPEALLAVAEGLDELLAMPDAKSNPWSANEWGGFPLASEIITTPEVKHRFDNLLVEHGLPPIQVQPADPKPSNDEAIAAVKAAIAEETDGENLLALQARLRLLTDTGETPFAVAEGHRVTADEDGLVDLPPVDAVRREARFAWAKTVRLGDMLDPPMDIIETATAYSKGGPLWLYLPAREVIMQMPEEWRRMMVEDVERDSPAQAQEMGRDILKDFEAGTPDITIETMANQRREN